MVMLVYQRVILVYSYLLGVCEANGSMKQFWDACAMTFGRLLKVNLDRNWTVQCIYHNNPTKHTHYMYVYIYIYVQHIHIYCNLNIHYSPVWWWDISLCRQTHTVAATFECQTLWLTCKKLGSPFRRHIHLLEFGKALGAYWRLKHRDKPLLLLDFQRGIVKHPGCHGKAAASGSSTFFKGMTFHQENNFPTALW